MNSNLSLPATRITQLANGMHLVIAERPGLPLVAVRLELASGTAHDPHSKPGLAEFAAQLLRRGTKTRTADQIDEAIERVGGSLGIDVDSDSTALAASLPSEHLPVALQILADLAQQPKFAASEVAAAKARTLAGLANDLDDPSSVADKAISHFSLGAHPYAHPGSGFSRSVKTFTRADVVEHHARAFGPDCAAMYVVGDLDGADVEALVQKRFGKWTRAAPPFEETPEVTGPSERQVIVVDKSDATQTQIRVASSGIPRNSPQYFDCMLAAGVLGGGFTSRLMEEIRVNRGLSYGVSSRFYSMRRGGEFAISTFTKNETVIEALQVSLETARALAAQGPTAEEMKRTQTYVNGLFPLQLETNEQLARMLADLRLYGIGDDYVSSFRDRVSAVTADKVKAAAQAHFPLEAYTIVCVGPAKHLKRALEPFGDTVKVRKLAELS